ncbi:Predicted kinase, aminoglycoside phosphotransferase (APT) family [Austwickia chelonae]|uniref:Putative phosphotransferase n=1 Tax=Austwickia chelonae NBRC 105200 TaxID=1184607 RepID=K6VKG6_9MICO|nr:phosphotransferase family protein [Austwickia chelonae]GAB77219.1 putative phosphotransferase [Austwickia chelonae NBRC 105200]SEW05423.1 Predicted kinase, aminoglycoside phosphotransferase (APT) family [Austwickia chelonae]
MNHPPGINLESLRTHLDQYAPDLLPGPLHAELLTGGRSNLTYLVSAGTQTAVLRRPPLGHVLDSAHDMRREHRVLTALSATPVPVPKTLLLVEDTTPLGVPFYLMEHISGTTYRSAAQLHELGPTRTARIGAQLLTVLADLHRISPYEIGLDSFGRPHGFCARQVERWRHQWEHSRTRDLPDADELHHRLAGTIPPEQAPAVIHGDYRLDNVLINTQDQIAAVIDWEMATLGDPLTDLGLLAVYHHLATIVPPGSPLVLDVPLAPGYPDLDHQLQLYTQTSGRPLDHLGWYEALAFYKLAVILEGIHHRHLAGQTVGDGFTHIGEYVAPLLAHGLSALATH